MKMCKWIALPEMLFYLKLCLFPSVFQSKQERESNTIDDYRMLFCVYFHCRAGTKATFRVHPLSYGEHKGCFGQIMKCKMKQTVTAQITPAV